MTCVNCKYQWCWLCEGQYSYNHYSSGKCQGYQFTKADSLEEAKKVEPKNYGFDYYLGGNYRRRDVPHCCFTLHSIFPHAIHGIDEVNIESYCTRYIYIFLMWTVGFLGFVILSLFDSPGFDDTEKGICLGLLVSFTCFFLFICYQIMFTILITPFILISLFYPYFINYIFKFLSMDIPY